MVLLALVGIAVAITRSFSKAQTVCEQAIGYVQAGKAEAFYQLLTADSKNLTPLAEWKKQITPLQMVYGQTAVPTLTSDPKNTSLTSKAVEATEEYELANFDSTYQITCFLSQQQDGTYLLNGFTSKAKLP